VAGTEKALILSSLLFSTGTLIVLRKVALHVKVDPAFEKASYSKRYELLCRRLVLERVYSAACLIMATNTAKSEITQPADDLSFRRFAAAMRRHVVTFLESQKT
jgi:hypothetical protein